MAWQIYGLLVVVAGFVVAPLVPRFFRMTEHGVDRIAKGTHLQHVKYSKERGELWCVCIQRTSFGVGLFIVVVTVINTLRALFIDFVT